MPFCFGREVFLPTTGEKKGKEIVCISVQHMKCMYLYTNTCLIIYRHDFDLFRRPLLGELDSKRGCTSCLSCQRKNCQISGYDPWKNERLRWQSVIVGGKECCLGVGFYDSGYYTDSALAAHKYEAHGLIAKEGL